MSNFGKAQLLKYGWSEGKGLGKNENGIAEALKPKLKFDTTGIGHKDTDFQWWSSVYDKALKNVVSENSSEKVSINVIKENAFNISSTQSGLEVSDKKIPLQYGKFLKTSTLKDGSLVRDKNCAVIEEDKTAPVPFTQLSDEQLFKACGGRTAHKGARHGLKLSGKLARIAEQEKQLLAGNFLKSSEISSDSTPAKKKKKTKKRKMSMDIEDHTLNVIVDNVSDNEDTEIPLIPSIITEDSKLSKRSIKKLKRKVNDLSHQLSQSSLSEKDESNANDSELEQQSSRKLSKIGTKKLKRKVNALSDQLSKSCLLDETAEEDQSNNVGKCEKQSQKAKKKSKKEKHKRKLNEHDVCKDLEDIQLDNEIVEPCCKKSKKQHKKSLESPKFEGVNGESIETDKESENSYSTWKNAKIKSKKLKKYEKKKKNKLHS